MARPNHPNGGRKSYGLEVKIKTLKTTLILAILEDCKKNFERKLYWAEKFVNRLMPNEVTGKDGDVLIPKTVLVKIIGNEEK